MKTKQNILQTTISHLKKPLNCLKSPLEHFNSGQTMEKSTLLEQKDIIADSSSLIYNLSSQLEEEMKSVKTETIEQKSATAVSQPILKKKIWKDKFPTSNKNTPPTQLLRILDQASALKEKGFQPFWTKQSKEISQKLWLPTGIDCVDSVLSSSNESSSKTEMGKSWFSIKKKRPQTENSLMTSFQSSQYSLRESMDSEVIPSKRKLKQQPKEKTEEKEGKEEKKTKEKTEKEGTKTKEEKNLKTIQFRLFPTEEEKKEIHKTQEQYKWFYNSSLTIIYLDYIRTQKKLEEEYKLSTFTVRDKIVGKYKYTEEKEGNLLFQDYVYDENNKEKIKPDWMGKNVHTRIQRGAINKLVYSINSCLSNKRNGNIREFNMKYLTSKSDTGFMHFEDSSFPSYLKKIESKYWYRDNNKQRRAVSFEDVFNDKNLSKKGVEIIYEKKMDRYFLQYPVDVNWFPSKDLRYDNQVSFVPSKENRIISLDPGVRKFMVGYDPKGTCVYIGDGANKRLACLLLETDKEEDEHKKYLLRRKTKHLVEELHWKTISYLVKNYDTIILPDFRISGMVKGKKMSKMTKRLLQMFSFFSFKLKLKYKCESYKKS
jgi:hypothetical protein